MDQTTKQMEADIAVLRAQRDMLQKEVEFLWEVIHKTNIAFDVKANGKLMIEKESKIPEWDKFPL